MANACNNKKYAHCPFCDSNLGQSSLIKGLIINCNNCGKQLQVDVDKYGVSVRVPKELSPV